MRLVLPDEFVPKNARNAPAFEVRFGPRFEVRKFEPRQHEASV